MNRPWNEIEEVFVQVVELEETERSVFLRDLCQSDADLYNEITSLLEADDKASKFINSPLISPSSLPDLLVAAAQAEGTIIARSLIGQQIGAYRIEREIGRGGMGEVYLATRADGVFSKNVAIKLIRCGIDTDFNIQRFRAERQILATLNHPNIAQLIDGGNTRDGMPYLIMEYIEGKPLFKFCAQEKLGLLHRLSLFRQICAAVAHAHEVGIIHRDIKPGNILITLDGLPKLLDFGIAKIINSELLDADSKTTATFMQQMTPEYASPEQINGEEVSYSSDVYSLGVLLYELLTSERPYRFQSRSPLEIARVVCETDPRKPSEFLTENGNFHLEFDDEVELKTQLEALDKIVLKALQKNPHGRYSSVADFKSDIEKFISNEGGSNNDVILWKALSAQNKTDSKDSGNKQTLSRLQTLPSGSNRKDLNTGSFTKLSGEQLTDSNEKLPALTVFKTSNQWLLVILVLSVVTLTTIAGYRYINRQAADIGIQNPQKLAEIKSLAVLHLIDATGKNEAVSKGLGENLTSKFGFVKKLSVTAANRGQDLKDKNPQEIGRDLNADFLLSGTLNETDGKFRIDIELIQTNSGQIVLKEQFVKEKNSFTLLQNDIVLKILSAFKIELSADEQAAITRNTTTDSQAYQLYLAGRYRLGKRLKNDIQQAITLFTEASERDPNFAQAYSGLADAHIIIARSTASPEESYRKAEQYALKALSLDPYLAETYVSLGMAKYRLTKDLTAENHFRRALELNHSLASAHHWYAVFLLETGKTEEAIREIKTAVQSDPRSPALQSSAGKLHLDARRYDEAAAFYEKAIEIDNGYIIAYYWLSFIKQVKGDYASALEIYNKARTYGDNNPDDPLGILMQAHVAASNGNRQEALNILDGVFKRKIYEKKKDPNVAIDIALVYNLLGDKDRTLIWLQKLKLTPGFDAKTFSDPRFANLSSDPRFAEFWAHAKTSV